jgi:hypothetical protein
VPKKINPCYKKNGINKTGQKYPFPKFIFDNKPVSFIIRLYGLYNFFKQENKLLSFEETFQTNIKLVCGSGF